MRCIYVVKTIKECVVKEMDDYSLASLNESKNEWCARLVNMLTPLVAEGLRSIFDEAWRVCTANDETEKYLATFQTFLGRVPGWNATMITDECKRITDRSGCSYLPDLITCIHIVQLKALSCVRVGTQQKKVDVNVPSLDDFVHRVYIQCARKVYTNVYLFEKGIPSLEVQKRNRELELIVRECIMMAIRDGIPMEEILRAYMEETQDKDTIVEEKNEILGEETVEEEVAVADSEPNLPIQPDAADAAASVEKAQVPTVASAAVAPEIVIETRTPPPTTAAETQQPAISFSDDDHIMSSSGREEVVSAPKTLERLDQIQREREQSEAQSGAPDGDGPSLHIGSAVSLAPLDVTAL